MMRTTLTARDKAIAVLRSNFKLQLSSAAAVADQFEAAATKAGKSDLALLVDHATRAWNHAVKIAQMSRASSPPHADEFVTECTRLGEHFTRTETLEKRPDLWRRWPTNPGTMFSWKGGDSALEVAIMFSRLITSATEFGRVTAFGASNLSSLTSTTNPEKMIFEIWRDATIQELCERTLPKLPAWPMWEIHRDRDALASKLQDEWQRSQIGLGPNDPRNRLCFEQWEYHAKTYKEIWNGTRQHPEWEQLSDDKAVRGPINSWAKKIGVDVTRRAAGRQPGKAK